MLDVEMLTKPRLFAPAHLTILPCPSQRIATLLEQHGTSAQAAVLHPPWGNPVSSGNIGLSSPMPSSLAKARRKMAKASAQIERNPKLTVLPIFNRICQFACSKMQKQENDMRTIKLKYIKIKIYFNIDMHHGPHGGMVWVSHSPRKVVNCSSNLLGKPMVKNKGTKAMQKSK